MTEAVTEVHALTPVAAIPGLPALASLPVGVVSQTPAPTDLCTTLPLMVNNEATAKQSNPTPIASLSDDFEASGSLDGDVSLASMANPAWR
jgi:hypothetical protein